MNGSTDPIQALSSRGQTKVPKGFASLWQKEQMAARPDNRYIPDRA